MHSKSEADFPSQSIPSRTISLIFLAGNYRSKQGLQHEDVPSPCSCLARSEGGNYFDCHSCPSSPKVTHRIKHLLALRPRKTHNHGEIESSKPKRRSNLPLKVLLFITIGLTLHGPTPIQMKYSQSSS